MRVTVFHNDKPLSLKVTKELRNSIEHTDNLQLDDQHPKLVITVGGDGTLLSAFHHYAEHVDATNFVGINAGHLGFYTDWLTNQMPLFLQNIAGHEGKSVSYPLLDVTVNFCGNAKPQHVLALNECMIKHSTSTMIAKVYFKDTYIETFRGDGICMSTPTGSTGYNKSLGGPILCPSITGMIFTEDAPISNNSYRSIGSPEILPANEPVTIIPNNHKDNEIYYDGRCVKGLPVKTLVYKISKHRIHFASYRHIPFWQRVSNAFVSEQK